MPMNLGLKTIFNSKQTRARVAELHTAHGVIKTPAFVPVGTQASVKALTPDDLSNLGAQCVLANTYHLYLRPGAEIIAQQGGLHGFMGWEDPIFTDSGGFQVFSLGIAMEHEVGKVVDLFADDSREEVALNKKIVEAKQKMEERKEKKEILDVRSFCKVDDEGSTFMSHLDGTLHRWTAEKSIQVQKLLGADMVLALDECTSPLHEYEYTKRSMERSHAWEQRSLKEFKRLEKLKVEGRKEKKEKMDSRLRGNDKRKGSGRQLIYGIVQGGPFEDLRKESARFVGENDFDGVAIGGALISKRKMAEIFDWVIPVLPKDRPRHLLGIGEIDDLFSGVKAGIDTFDCAHPTRIARRGNLYISPENGGNRKTHWRVGIGHQEFKNDGRAIDPGCDCYTCLRFSRAYLRHLYWAKELTYYRLASIHNLRFLMRLMEEIREAVKEERLGELEKKWVGGVRSRNR